MALGIDLSVNKQSGMSRGLIFLFDRNKSHIVVESLSLSYFNLTSPNVVMVIGCYHKIIPPINPNASDTRNFSRSYVREISITYN